MFIGHFGTGLAGKKFDSGPSLGTMFIAAQLPDILFPIFLLLGIEKVKIVPGITTVSPLDLYYYPFSHSLLGVIFWGIVLGAIYYLIRKNIKGSIVLGSLVVVHWICDLIVHRPDLQIVPWSEIRVGFGAWNSVILTLLIEGIIFIIGAYLYIKATKSKNKIGRISLWSLLIFLAVIYSFSLTGSPPPSKNALAFVGLSGWIIIAWGYWIDKNRISVS